MVHIGEPTPLPLCESDLDDLYESGLTDTTIRANGLRTDRNALVFPYRDLDGAVNCFARWKPHKPRVVDGKLVKYEQPVGSPLRAYFPLASVPKLRDDNCPVFVVEGEKKALALSQLEVVAVSIGGVWCGNRKGTDQLIDDLAAIDWRGRTVYIVFDYDAKVETRRHVDTARRRLAKALRAVGAQEVLSVNLPPGPGGAKQGVDDFLVANGGDTFHALVSQAQPVPSCEVQPLRTAAGRTDAANAARLVAKFGEVIRWVGPWDRWLIWDGKRWRIDDSLEIQALAKRVAAQLWEELKAEIADLDSDKVKQIYAYVRASNNASGIRAMVALARSEPGIAIRVEELDADPWLLNVENGTIDLRTGKLREHRRGDFITKLAPVVLDPKATCPTWLKFLDSIFAGNSELIGYLQRLVGYSLTGVTEEHILPFLYGTGANGKSTFCELVMKQFGPDYSMKAPPDLLMTKHGESHPTERADLWGKRAVFCIETEAGRHMAEALVKELTGGDRVRARRMREDFWEFVPTHHVWLSSNYKPVVTGTDYGIWRRIKLIPFDVVIPDSEQDKKLPAKLEAELPGVLDWAIAGCLDWQRNGMQEPSVVRDATKEYSEEMDDVGQFIEAQCDRAPEYMTPATVLYQSFVESTGSKISQKRFGSELKRRGFRNGRITAGVHKAKMGWFGLRLAPAEATKEGLEKLKDSVKKRKGGK